MLKQTVFVLLEPSNFGEQMKEKELLTIDGAFDPAPSMKFKEMDGEVAVIFSQDQETETGWIRKVWLFETKKRIVQVIPAPALKAGRTVFITHRPQYSPSNIN